MGGLGGLAALLALVAAGVAAGCQRGSLDGSPPDAGLAAAIDGGGAAGPGGPGIGRGDGGGGVVVDGGAPAGPGQASGGVSMPVAPGCVVSSTAPWDWTEVAAPAELAGFQITDAWAAPGRDDIFFAAMLPPSGSPPIAAARIWRWTKGCWKLELSWSTTVGLPPSVSGSDTDDVWATVGDALVHRDASGWLRAEDQLRAVMAPEISSARPAFGTVRVGASGIWLTADHAVWQHDWRGWRAFELTTGDVLGTQPSPQSSQSSQSLDDPFWFTALALDGDGVAIAGAADVSGPLTTPAFVYRYDGRVGSGRVVGSGTVDALSSDGLGGLWVGAAASGSDPTLLHLDGASKTLGTWSLDDLTATAQTQALWSRGWNDTWAAAGAYLAHWDGNVWSVSAPPPVTSGVTILTGDAGSLWFVTAGPRFFRVGR
jgi:hypothetical protein